MLREIWEATPRWFRPVYVLGLIYGLVGIVAVVGMVVAQDEAAAVVCDASRGAEIVADLQEEVGFAQAGLDLDDMPGFVGSLRMLSRKAALAQAECMGLVFDSETLGLQPAIGPVMLPAGTYRVTATTAGYLIAEVTVISGECDDGPIFILSKGDADSGAQVVFQSEECMALIAISNTREPWTMDFELLVAG